MTFILRNKNRPAASIYLLVNFRGNRFERSIGESVPAKYWNANKKRAKAIAEYPLGKDTNDVLDKWEEAAKKAVKFYKQYLNNPTNEAFFDKVEEYYYEDKIDAPEEPEIPYLTDYMAIFIERNSIGKSDSCRKKYNTCRNKILDYEKSRKIRLRFEDINMEFYSDFKKWFFGNGWRINYFGNTINTLKQMMDEARDEDELHNSNKHHNKAFVGTREEVDSVYCNDKELQAIFDLVITPDFVTEFALKNDETKLDRRQAQDRADSYNLIRDRFLIGAYTGLRVSDFRRLKEAHIQGNFLRLRNKKTYTGVMIPINTNLKEILDRSDLSENVSTQKINEHIKDIARMAGITEDVVITHSKGGKHQETTNPKHKLISCHTARRSFATNAFWAGVDVYDIMRILGHTKIATTIKYLKVSSEEVARKLETHDFFK